jgi:ABC-type dipeptide/oligopeptide/nickel transport system ATPase component
VKKIVCLWGGPGTGKSTTAAGVFSLLKKKGYNAELQREYVKNWVWEGRAIKPGDQTYIFCKQARVERQYMDAGIDFIISDSPMALSILYGELHDDYERRFRACELLLKQHHAYCQDKGYKVDHFFLQRQKAYNPAGRFQTEDEAKGIDKQCIDLLGRLKINYETLVCGSDIEMQIVERVII